MGRKQRKELILENIEVLRAGAKGVSVGKTEEGKTVLIQDAVPRNHIYKTVKLSQIRIIDDEFSMISGTDGHQFGFESFSI